VPAEELKKMPSAHRRFWTIAASALLVFSLLVVAVLHWGGYSLVSADPLPFRADGAVILQASLASENARIAGAVELLQRNVVNRVLLSIPPTGYWGVSFPSLARAYLEKQYGLAISNRFEFCITDQEIDSTEAEALALIPCIQERHWNSVIIVTSNFHSRRAGIVWRRTSKREKLGARIFVDGVPDPAFRPDGWWRHRKYAKTWFYESIKLLWTFVGK